MAYMKHIATLLLVATGVVLPLPGQGVIPRWEVEELAKGIDEQAAILQQLLEQVRPKEWIQDGAPDAYIGQHETLLGEIENLRLSAQALGRQPTKLSSAVDTFLWMDRVGSMMESLSAGVRRYQNPAVADMLDSARSRSQGPEQQLKEYMRQLVVLHEAEMEIAHSEAQRCRETLAKQPRH
jgi:hypothetical protein